MAFVETSVDKYVTKFSETDGRKILTKDKAYIAAGQVVSRVKKLKGVNKQNFLDEHFEKVWNDHDKDHNNMIEREDVQ